MKSSYKLIPNSQESIKSLKKRQETQLLSHLNSSIDSTNQTQTLKNLHFIIPENTRKEKGILVCSTQEKPTSQNSKTNKYKKMWTKSQKKNLFAGRKQWIR